MVGYVGSMSKTWGVEFLDLDNELKAAAYQLVLTYGYHT